MKYLVLVFLVLSSASYGQSDFGKTFFKLPVLQQNDYVPSEVYVSCNFYELNQPLKNYRGDNASINRVQRLLKAITLNTSAAYEEMSVKSDSAVIDSYRFYHQFVKYNDPVLVCLVQIGNYSLCFVNTDTLLPLMIFCLNSSTGTFSNNPSVLNQPEIIAVIEAINKIYFYPTLFLPLKAAPAKNIKVTFKAYEDDGFAFYMDTVAANINCTTSDKTKRSDLSDPYQNFYCAVISDLREGLIENYFSALTAEGREMVQQSLASAAAGSKQVFCKYKARYSVIRKMIDLGSTKLIIASDDKDLSATQDVYLIKQENLIKWINVNKEFYFDDLLKTREFLEALK